MDAHAPRFDDIPEDEWGYVDLPEQRKAFLSQPITFEEVAARIAARLTVLECNVEPYWSAKSPQEREARQVVFRIGFEPAELCDLFFNSRDGLRARYWRSPEAGDAATHYLIRSLLPALIHAATRAPIKTLGGTAPMNTGDLYASLKTPSAKVWPVEDERDSKGGLEVRRWRENPHPRYGDEWRWMPERCDLNVKGALLDLKHVEYISPDKRDRAMQIHCHGYT